MKKGILLLFSVFVSIVMQLSLFAFSSELTDDYYYIAKNYFNSFQYQKAFEYLDLILDIEPDNKNAALLKEKITQRVYCIQSGIIPPVEPASSDSTVISPREQMPTSGSKVAKKSVTVQVKAKDNKEKSVAKAPVKTAVKPAVKSVNQSKVIAAKKDSASKKSVTVSKPKPDSQKTAVSPKQEQVKKQVVAVKKEINQNNETASAKMPVVQQPAIENKPVIATPLVQETRSAESQQVAPAQIVSPQPVQQNMMQAENSGVIFDSKYYNAKGLENFQKGDLDTAISYFFKASHLNPKNAQAYNNLGMCYWKKNNTPAAIKYFTKANQVNKSFTQPLVNLSNIYKQSSDEKKQVYYLSKAIKLNPSDYLAYYWMGDYYKNKGLYDSAINNFKEVIKINPKYPPVFLALGVCFLDTEEFNYAVLALNQYTDFVPNSAEAYYLRTRAYLAMNKYTDAKVDLQRAITLNDKPEYRFELGKIEYYLENYSSAIDLFTSFISGVDSAEAYNYRGLCYYKLRNVDAAISDFNKAIELDGLRPIYYYNLAQCYKSLGDKKNYSKYVATATKITPINYQDFIDLSYIYFDNSNPNYAINVLNNAISKYPDVKSLYLSKLKIYESIGDSLHYNETKDIINKRFNKK